LILGGGDRSHRLVYFVYHLREKKKKKGGESFDRNKLRKQSLRGPSIVRKRGRKKKKRPLAVPCARPILTARSARPYLIGTGQSHKKKRAPDRRLRAGVGRCFRAIIKKGGKKEKKKGGSSFPVAATQTCRKKK